MSYTPVEHQLFNVSERTELAVATYQALGLVTDSGKATEVIGQQMQTLHDGLTADGTPSVGVEVFKPVDFQGGFTLNALVNGYNQLTHKDGSAIPETDVWHELWDQYAPDELNRRSFDDTNDQPAADQARAMLLGGDKVGGLYFTGISLEDQEEAIKALTAEYNAKHTRVGIGIMNIADVLVVNAQRIVEAEGRELLDSDGAFTRISQLGRKPVGSGSYVGSVGSDGGQLGLRESSGLPGTSGGVRVWVGPKAQAA